MVDGVVDESLHRVEVEIVDDHAPVVEVVGGAHDFHLVVVAVDAAALVAFGHCREGVRGREREALGNDETQVVITPWGGAWMPVTSGASRRSKKVPAARGLERVETVEVVDGAPDGLAEDRHAVVLGSGHYATSVQAVAHTKLGHTRPVA